MSKISTVIKTIKLYKNWIMFFLYRLHIIRNNDTILRFRNGLEWHVDTTQGGSGIISDVWIANPYDFLLERERERVIIQR